MRLLFNFFASLRLTVVLLALSMVLIFLATLDQVDWGVYEVQHRYFQTLVAWAHYPTQFPGASALQGLKVPLPGGFLLGGLLLVNLLCAHFRYFRAKWSKAGIALIHGGVVLLIVSGFTTAYLQQENFMWIDVGGHSNYIESFRDVDLVLIDHTDPKEDVVVSIPSALLKPGTTIQNPALPFTLRPTDYFPNTAFFMRSENPNMPTVKADHGVALNTAFGVASKPFDYAKDTQNIASAVIAVDSAEGSKGTWLVSTLFDGKETPPFLAKNLPQTFTVGGHTWEMTLRPRREYLPYTIYLDKFIHETYPASNVPKRYESQVRLVNLAAHEDRQVFIYMNHPLRYQGLTFFQASFAPGDTSSMLQVVRNPGWLLPYFSVAIVGLGLCVQFLLSFIKHLRSERAPATVSATATASYPARRAAPREPVAAPRP